MRPSPQPYGAWTKRCEEWLKDLGVLKADQGEIKGYDRR